MQTSDLRQNQSDRNVFSTWMNRVDMGLGLVETSQGSHSFPAVTLGFPRRSPLVPNPCPHSSSMWKTLIPTLIDPRAISTRAGVNSGWEWDFRMDPSGPGAVPGTRHSWLAPLVTRPGMPPGPFGAIRKSFIPIRLLLRMYCVSG